ncbi:hypothetical protein ABS768_01755 [Flavobacterium sp. ST-75]|uniref:Beta-lactamase-related domain-containing protein n=2 Tax=Flavobacterium rhizophilum TaxID=3163296 RepID=A0ABW8Y7L7_9FLAO
MTGVGDVVSDSGDLNKIMNALFEMKLINSNGVELMKPSEGTQGRWLEKFYFYDKTFYGHSGATVGTKTITAINPIDGLTVTIILNVAVLPTSEYLGAVLSTIYIKSYEIPDYVNYYAAPEDLKPYEGLYSADDFPMDIHIFVEDGRLFAQATDQMAFPLAQYTSNEFGFASDGIRIKFNSGRELLIIQGGQELIFIKDKRGGNRRKALMKLLL